MPVDLETAEWWKDQADEARAERDHLALRLEEVKAELAATCRDCDRWKAEAANLRAAEVEVEDLRDRLAKAGARLSTVEGSRVEVQVEAEATTKATARKVVDEVVDEALHAVAVVEGWLGLGGLDRTDAYRLILEELRDRATARISAIDDFSAEMPF